MNTAVPTAVADPGGQGGHDPPPCLVTRNQGFMAHLIYLSISFAKSQIGLSRTVGESDLCKRGHALEHGFSHTDQTLSHMASLATPITPLLLRVLLISRPLSPLSLRRCDWSCERVRSVRERPITPLSLWATITPLPGERP